MIHTSVHGYQEPNRSLYRLTAYRLEADVCSKTPECQIGVETGLPDPIDREQAT